MKPKTKSAASGITLSRILVPIDFSIRSRNAVQYAVGLARQSNARLILLHVVEPIIYPADLGYAPSSMQTVGIDYRKAAKEKLVQWQQEEVPPELKSELRIALGKPFREITAVAQKIKADLIVLSTHGYTGLKHVLLGSTAERVVRHASCPVLTLPDRGKG
jgi:universal stress protein A